MNCCKPERSQRRQVAPPAGRGAQHNACKLFDRARRGKSMSPPLPLPASPIGRKSQLVPSVARRGAPRASPLLHMLRMRHTADGSPPPPRRYLRGCTTRPPSNYRSSHLALSTFFTNVVCCARMTVENASGRTSRRCGRGQCAGSAPPLSSPRITRVALQYCTCACRRRSASSARRLRPTAYIIQRLSCWPAAAT